MLTKKESLQFFNLHANLLMWTSEECRGNFSTKFKWLSAAGPQSYCPAVVGLIFEKDYY